MKTWKTCKEIGTALLVRILCLCHGSAVTRHVHAIWTIKMSLLAYLKRLSIHKKSIESKLNSCNSLIIVIFKMQKWLRIICKMAISRGFNVIYGCLLLGHNIIHIDYTFSQAPQQQSHFIRHLLIPGATSYLPSSLLLPIAMS